MTKHANGRVKKWVVIAVAVAVVVLAGAGYYGYAHYTQYQAAQTKKQQVLSNNKTKLDDVAFKGDRNLAAQYLAQNAAGNQQGARSVYDQAVAGQPQNSQISLYSQAVMAAKTANNTSDTLYFMEKLATIEQSYQAYGALADLYAAQHNTAGQREYLQKAVADLEKRAQASAAYQPLLTNYQQQLQKLGTS